MKNKFAVFVAVFISFLAGFSLAIGDGFGFALDFVLVVLNLYLAGFFEDSK